MTSRYRTAILTQRQTLSDALKNMNDSGFRAALVVNEQETLLGLITDFDVRTALMSGLAMNAPVTTFMNAKPHVGYVGITPSEARDLMVSHGNECLPVVDGSGRIVELILLRDFVAKDDLLSPIVIMAGGQGKRLLPLTLDTPKPLLPVAERPMLEHILNHVKIQGFKTLFVSTHYKSEQVEAFIEDQLPDGLQATIIKEENPLGTAGCLKCLERGDNVADKDTEPIFIMNGDILTTLDFQAMLDWHNTHGNILTLACRQYVVEIPYGILETDGQRLTGIQEKPRKVFNINAGIYLMERQALQLIPENRHFDMPDLMDALMAAGLQVGTFPISEPWIDIGKHEDYERVNQDFQQFMPTRRREFAGALKDSSGGFA